MRGITAWTLACLLVAVQASANEQRCDAAASIPPRATNALSGAGFVQEIAPLDDASREAAIERELDAGNVPSFLRRTVPVVVDQQRHVVVCVLADYLAVGSDRDSFLVPLHLPTAMRVAHKYGFVLPTSRIVDAVYAQAKVQLAPQPLPAGAAMRSTAYYRQHNAMVAAQRDAAGLVPGTLVGGHKKDLVLTERLWRNPARVAIYGWHRGAAAPIQPLSTVHGADYADYSHGVRLVAPTIYVDGRPVPIATALADPVLGPVLNGEGAMPHAAALLHRFVDTAS